MISMRGGANTPKPGSRLGPRLGVALVMGGLLAGCGGDETPACVEGATRCSGDALEICTAEGVFLTYQVCSLGCSADGGAAACDAPSETATYVGSETCAFCHASEEVFTTFPASAHAHALTAVEDDQAPGGAVPSAPPGLGWDDVTYMIGGQYHRALFTDRRGYVLTGDTDAPDVQYVVEDGSYVPYRTGELLPFDCASCHTTGYDASGEAPHHLPGVVGSWSEDGVQCEACHGPGSRHATTADPVDIVTDASLEGCASCHSRTGGETIEAEGGFLLPNAQYEEVLASPHGAELSCADCHSPHASMAQAGVATCTDCHAGQRVNLGMEEVACVECHMPKVVHGATEAGPYEADLRSHLVAINTDPAGTLLNEAGDAATGTLSLDYTCLRCHEDQTTAWASQTAGLIHAEMPSDDHFVGDETCAACHQATFDQYSTSGHPFILQAVVDGAAPSWPYTAVPDAPPGTSWSQIAYVVGGYSHMANFVDTSGRLITGAGAQYDLATSSFSSFHAGETLGYDCASCHTTGYDPAAPSQGGLAQVTGGWAQDGVRCEACHGAGGRHVLTNQAADIVMDPSAQACGACHTNGDPQDRIVAEGAFIRHEGQYQEWLASPHAGGGEEVSCVGCHDPHLGSTHTEPGADHPPGLKATCESCHAEQAQNQKSESMRLYNTTCLDCHMPLLTKAAVADPATFTADVRTHIVDIDVDAADGQIEDGFSKPYLSLEAACSSCHHRGGVALVHPVEEMKAVAEGYHDAP